MTDPTIPDWDEAPEAQEVDLTQMSEAQRLALLESHIDQEKARTICARIDGSAHDYVTNMKRINQIVGYIQFGLGTALRISKLA